MGIVGLFMGLQYKSGLDMAKRLDHQQYSEEETVTLKVPLALPYHVDSENFERVDGEIEHGGEFYRLVKQKLEKDTLYIVCIKDQNSQLIKQALTDYVKTFTDKPVDGKQNSKFAVGFIKDFLPTSIEITPCSHGWNYALAVVGVNGTFSNSRAIAVTSPPPQG